MRIIKYTKLSNDMYKITLDSNKTTKIHEDLILKYNLLLTKEIDDDILLKLEHENITYEAYNIAIKYIKARLRSKSELFDYLKNKGVGESKINEVINLLEHQGYLNDEIYIKSFINDKILLSNDGPYKIKKELLTKGFNEEKIDKYLKVLTPSLEKERVDKIISKQSEINKKSNYQFKLKLKLYLSNLGYSNEIVNDSLNSIKIDEETLKKKEYDKVYKKYSKKYEGYELDYKIKQALYAKGFK